MFINSTQSPNRPAFSKIPETIGDTSVSASAWAPGSQICRPIEAVLVMKPTASSTNTQGAAGTAASASALRFSIWNGCTPIAAMAKPARMAKAPPKENRM